MTKELRELLQKVEEMKTEVRTLLEDNKVEEAETKMVEVRSMQKKIELQKEIDEQEEREIDNKMEKREDDNKMEKRTDKKELELRALRKVLLREELTEEERTAVTTVNGAAILPQGFVNEIETLRKGYVQLKNYVHVIPVSTNTGKAPLSKGMVTKKLADLVQDQELVKDMVTLLPVEYAVSDYGKIVPVQNQVLEDTTTNFMDVLNEDFVECAVNTENEKIVNAVKTVCVEKTGADYKALVKAINGLSPNAKKRAIIITNSTGFSYLDELEDKNGKPLLKSSYAEGSERLMFKGLEVIEVDPEILADEVGKAIFYIVDARKVIKFFDRKGYELGVSKEALFTYNQTAVRMIERFDVKPIADNTDTDVQKFAVKVSLTIAA
ncbi:phage major capsid protein [Proteiniborus sp. MB09-C3]|uniref:phage major capsid protein n=1 Tax=Proteiniborus sp. MB09-C3 TaxID=3050072 RepID=UPI0025537481|nr:phage major capsid protein [Proteiniborus sp. MB09-C3]WIV10539.1 phage major capsid protein [Proteiniborus sp. MB09-C3]